MPRHRSTLDGDTLAAVGAMGVPLLAYSLTAGGHSYWLDSAELTAAALALDIAHPPGHPLASLWGKAWTWLPVGPLPYRVALAQAIASALALGLVYRSLVRTLAPLLPEQPVAGRSVALGATWLLAGSYGFWFQSVRAEVYALEMLLIAVSLERATAVLSPEERTTTPLRALLASSFALGLGLTNHHFMALLALPPLAWLLVDAWRMHGARALWLGIVAGALGLPVYLYLPLRAATEPPMDLGHPVEAGDLAWVVSARVYARNLGSDAIEPLGTRFADLAVILVENFTPLPVLLALLGAYVLVRNRATWPLASLWIGTALVSLCGRAWLNPVRANPDVLGYMLPGFAALVALAASGVGALLASLRTSARTTRALSLTCVLLGLGQLVREAPHASLRAFAATAAFASHETEPLPPRALVIATSPELAFRFWESAAVEQARRDLTLFPAPFLGYGGLARVFSAHHPELASMVERYLATGVLDAAQVDALARTRPVFVELDTVVTRALFAHSLPDGLLYRYQTQAPDARALGRAAAARRGLAHTLQQRLAGSDVHDPETRKHLVWSGYIEALYFASQGALPAARESTSRALALSPRTRELVALRRALAAAPAVRVDLAPFFRLGTDAAAR